MRYKDQLYVILSFISLRILTLVLLVFYMPAQIGTYTPYILFLYAVCEILVLFYLYHFTKNIKAQHLSLAPFILLALIITYSNVLQVFIYPIDNGGLSTQEILIQQMLLTLPAYFVKSISEIIIAIQLFKNKATGSLKVCFRLVGWSYLLMIFIALVPRLVAPTLIPYNAARQLSGFSAVLPLLAMLLLFGNELRQNSSSSNPTLDGQL